MKISACFIIVGDITRQISDLFEWNVISLLGYPKELQTLREHIAVLGYTYITYHIHNKSRWYFDSLLLCCKG